MTDAIVDACCFINLYATGDIRGFLAELGWTWHIPSAVFAESLYIRVPDADGQVRQEPIESQACIDEELLVLVDVQSGEEAELYVRLASDLDDGEAMALAIAKRRRWMLATDDHKAKKFAVGLGVPVITTPELMQHWAETAKIRPAKLKTLLSNIESHARFAPAEDAVGYDWWAARVGK